MSEALKEPAASDGSDAKQDEAASISLLSGTELAVIRLLATGASNREIAHERGISEATVKKHVTNINGKIGTSNRVEITRMALTHGLIEVDRPPRADDGERERTTRELAEALERERNRAKELELARTRHRLRVRVLVGTVVVLGLALMALAMRESAPQAPGGLEPTPTTASERETLPLWVPIRALPEGRTGLALGVAAGGVYAIGGWDGRRVLSETLRFEPEQVAWRAAADKPTAVREARAVEVRGQLVVPGGCDATGRALAVVEVFEPGANRWRDAAPLPAPRCAYALAALDGQVYLFGGRTSVSSETAVDDVFRYDPEGDAWTRFDSLPSPRSDLAAAAVSGTGGRNEIHVVGGRDRDGDLERDHWIFQPFERPRWDEAATPLPQGRAGHVMAALDSPLDRLYVVGGGWDGPLEDDAGTIGLTLDDEAGWVPFARVPGPTPRRGAGLAILGRTLFLAGGETGAGTGPSQDAYRYETFTPLDFR